MRADAYWSHIDVPRAVWDPTEGRHPRHGERSWESIVGLEVHWVGTGKVGDHGDTTTELLGFERFHQVSKGWADLFYNVAVDTDGVVYEGRDATIPSQSNLRRWLTCLVVLGDQDTPTEADLDRVQARLHGLWLAVSPMRWPTALRVHRERSSTQCPGEQVHQLVIELRTGAYRPPTLDLDPFGDDPMQLITDPEKARQWLVWTGADDDGEPCTFVREYGTVRAGAGVDIPGAAFVIDEQVRAGRIVKVPA